MAKFTPFPTFGGKDGIAGITPVKLAPTQMRFPTTRGPSRRAPEPTDKEKLAPLLPFLVGGVTDALGIGKPKGSDEEYLESLYDRAVVEPKNLQDIKQNQKIQAQIDAYNLYGRPEEKSGFGLDEVINIGVASQMGRGASNYAKSYLNLKNAEEKDRLTKMTGRASYVSTATNDDPYQLKTFFDLDAAKLGKQSLVEGIFNPSDGNRYMHTKNGLVPLPDNYIEYIPGQAGTDISKFTDKMLVGLKETTDEIITKDKAALQSIRVANELIINNLDPAINGKTPAPGSYTAAFSSFANNLAVEVESVGTLLGGGDFNNWFGTQDNSKGTQFDGKGTNAKLIWGDMSDFIAGGGDITAFGDTPEQQEAYVNGMLDKLAPAYKEVHGKDIRDLFQNVSANKAITMASYLQLAYMSAATAGQTGRTLSDKDLAYFLEMVGGGLSNSPKVQKTNLLRFIDSVVTGQDINAVVELAPNTLRQYKPDVNEVSADLLYPYYEPRRNEAGEELWDDYVNLKYKPFRERYNHVMSIRGIPIMEEWYNHTSPLPDIYPREKFQAGKTVSTTGDKLIPVPPKPDISEQEKQYLD